MAERSEPLQSSPQSVLAEIDRAFDEHEQWYEAIARALACRPAAGPPEIASGSVERCPFGRWYRDGAPDAVRRHALYGGLGDNHRRMHEAASVLIGEAEGGLAAQPELFDAFVGAAKRFRADLRTLRRALVDDASGLDPLTGVEGRIAMLPFLRRQHALVQRGIANCAVAMIDLDFFKKINDTHGHAAGDRVLIAVAGKLRSLLRPYDRLFRYGGEEFLLCAPHTDVKAAHALVERLRAALADAGIDAGLGAPLRVTVSAGVAALDPAETVERSIGRADAAMYAAKLNGRNRTEIWMESTPAAPQP